MGYSYTWLQARQARHTRSERLGDSIVSERSQQSNKIQFLCGKDLTVAGCKSQTICTSTNKVNLGFLSKARQFSAQERERELGEAASSTVTRSNASDLLVTPLHAKMGENLESEFPDTLNNCSL